MATKSQLSNGIFPIECSKIAFDLIIIFSWILFSLLVYFLFKHYVRQKAIKKARFFVGYTMVSLLIVTILIGNDLFSKDLYLNILSELIGITLTVLIIDRIYHYLTERNEKLHRDISLRYCKVPIFRYCYIWFGIYEPNQTTRMNKLQQYSNLEVFFMSDDFYNSVCRFNFSNQIAPNKTYAQYYAESLDKTEENFQNILAKYASKLSLEDIQRLEFFGGGSYLYRVFRVMDFLRTVQVTVQVNNITQGPPANLVFLNDFTQVSKNNFQKHFKKLLALIENFNAVCNPNDQWTLETLNTLTTLSGPNADNFDW